MPDSYAQLGKTVGGSGILNALTGGGSANYNKGYEEGVDLQNKATVSQAQATKMGAETQKILDALQQSKAAQAMTGERLYRESGGEFDRMAGPERPGNMLPEDTSAPMDPSRLNEMKLLKAVQTMAGGPAGGGNANVLMQALQRGSDMGAERQAAAEGGPSIDMLARLRAAREGKDRPSTAAGGGSSVASKIQEFQQLTAPREQGGAGMTPEQAAGMIYGRGEGQDLVKILSAMLSGRGMYGPAELQQMLPQMQTLIDQARSGGAVPPGGGPPPGAIIHDYTQ